MSVNKVTLVGYVGQDPTVRWLDTGVCVASVSLGTKERSYTLQNGTVVPERTEWHSVIFWGKQAEIVESYVHKGDKLFVEGKLQTRTFDDKNGMRRQVAEVMVHTLELLSGRSTNIDTTEEQQ